MHVIGYITHIWRTFWCSVNSFSYALNTSVPIRERQQAVLGQGITDARKHSARAHNIIPCKHAFSFRISDHEIINERIDAQYTAAHLIQYYIYEKYATAVRSPCKVGQCCCSALFPLELGRHVSRIRACPAASAPWYISMEHRRTTDHLVWVNLNFKLPIFLYKSTFTRWIRSELNSSDILKNRMKFKWMCYLAYRLIKFGGKNYCPIGYKE